MVPVRLHGDNRVRTHVTLSMGLRQLSLRGKIKARIHLLWFAVARNMMRFFALHAKAQAAA
jgi:hypothetical protein